MYILKVSHQTSSSFPSYSKNFKEWKKIKPKPLLGEILSFYAIKLNNMSHTLPKTTCNYYILFFVLLIVNFLYLNKTKTIFCNKNKFFYFYMPLQILRDNKWIIKLYEHDLEIFSNQIRLRKLLSLNKFWKKWFNRLKLGNAACQFPTYYSYWK